MSKTSKKIAQATLAGMFAAGVLATTAANAAVPSQPKHWEKCAGISKAGKNDCGALDGKHGCAGQATSTNSDQEWVYLPKGTCDKITGGIAGAVKPAKS